MEIFFNQLLSEFKNSSFIELVAVIGGIVSVWFSKKENMLVFPTGLVCTALYIYVSAKEYLIGEAAVNTYYTIMNIYGWFLWTRKTKNNEILYITFSARQMLVKQLLFFAVAYGIFFFSLTYLQKAFFPGALPWADSLASATAVTAMWLMARKKVESWYWWIATNAAAIPLYYSKGLVLTSTYYFILFFMAIGGLQEWKRKATEKL